MPTQTLTIELPDVIYSVLMNKAELLHQTPSFMITQALEHDLGLVGLPLDDEKVFGDEKQDEK
jgi:predicted transcriptional regulator